MQRLRRVLEILIFVFAVVFIAMFFVHNVNAKGIVRSVEDHSKDYPLPRFITYEQYINDPFLLCTGKGISIPGYNSATVVSGSYSTHTTDQGKDTGELTAADVGSATVFDDGSYKGLKATTSKTYGYYTEATHRSATPAEVYILAELNDNTPGNGSEFRVTDTEYTGTVQEDAYVEVNGVKYYMVQYNDSHEATMYVAKVNDKYYEVEVRDGEGMGNYSAVQVAWWAVSPAQEGGRVPDNSLAKEAREFEKYINALSKGGKWHYSDGEAKEATAMTLNKTELIMYAGDTAQLLLSMEPTNLEKKELTWTTSDKEIAEVTGRGVIKAKKRGKVRITVALKEKPELKAECIVIVKQPIKATAIKLDKTELTLTVDETAELKATLEPADATSNITWSSSNTNVVRVENGKVTAVKKGTAIITAKANGKKATCKVTVKAKETESSDSGSGDTDSGSGDTDSGSGDTDSGSGDTDSGSGDSGTDISDLKPGTYTAKGKYETFKASNGKTVKYRVYMPANLNPSGGLPIHLYLHGSGESGTSLDNASLPALLRKGQKASGIVICPQGSSGSDVNDSKSIVAYKELLESYIKKYNVDRNKISASGHSAGAIGVTKFINTYPGYLSIGVLLSPYTLITKNPKPTKVIVVCGSSDQSSPLQCYNTIPNGLKNFGYKENVDYARYKLIGYGHGTYPYLLYNGGLVFNRITVAKNHANLLEYCFSREKDGSL